MELSDTNIFHMHEYKYAKKDSLLEYEILVISTEKPFEVNVKYSLQNKTYKDSTYVRDSLYIKEVEKVRVNQIYVGGSAIVYPGLKGVFIGADFVSKKGWMLGLEAGILNETNLAGKIEFKKLISFRRAKRD